MPPTQSAWEVSPVLVEITRGPLVESRHRGRISAVSHDGERQFSLGDVSIRTFLRSAAKPFQAIPIIASGAFHRFGFSQAELAVMTASHSGQPVHTETVLSILARIGLDESALLCGAHEPFDEDTLRRLREVGSAPTALHNNCSGKHAGMLALAIHLGASTDNYLDPSHPVQLLIRDTLAAFAHVEPSSIDVAIDGCSAPVFGLSVEEMARSYAHLIGHRFSDVDPLLRAAASTVIEAMTMFPQLVGGSHGRLDTELMTIASGSILSKVGAEGVQLLGILPGQLFPRGLGIAIKIDDGDARRARDPVVIDVLHQLGALDDSQVSELSSFRQPIRNHRGVVVGEIRTCFTFAQN